VTRDAGLAIVPAATAHRFVGTPGVRVMKPLGRAFDAGPDSCRSQEDRMTRPRSIALAAVVLDHPRGCAVRSAAGDIDRTAVDVKTPSEIKWVKNAAEPTSQPALRRSEQPGPYVVRVKWFSGNMSGRHSIPTTGSSRFFGTWWMGTARRSIREHVPAPAGSYVIHYGGRCTTTGEDRGDVIQVWALVRRRRRRPEKR